jgi:hypothetical protein
VPVVNRLMTSISVRLLNRGEWLALSAWLLAAGGVYFGLIHSSWQHVAAQDEALAARLSAEKSLEASRLKFDQTQRRILGHQRELEHLGGSPPLIREKDIQIARVMTLAQQCGISVDRYQPIDSVEQVDHTAFFVEFVGRGDFLAMQTFFRRLEGEIDFVDITHFSATLVDGRGAATPSASPDQTRAPGCLITWSCRINGMRSDAAAESNDPNRPASAARVKESGNES